MHFLRMFLGLVFITIAGYTAVVIENHGITFLPVFLRDIGAMAWPGQFNVDFLCLLALSGLWVAYRHQFGAVGILLGACAVLGGATFMSVYLIVISRRVRDDPAALMLGEKRLGAPAARH